MVEEGMFRVELSENEGKRLRRMGERGVHRFFFHIFGATAGSESEEISHIRSFESHGKHVEILKLEPLV